MAKRDKLTHRQKRQVAQKQRQRLKKTDKPPELSDLSEARDGIIISRFGEQADVLSLGEHQQYRCFLRQNLGAPVPGDKVSFRLDPNNQGIVEAMYERNSVLTRPAQHQGVKPIVANIEQVFIVTAPLPDFSSVLLDRYLVAVNNAQLKATIIFNKWDLCAEISAQAIESQLPIYQSLGYPVLKTCAKNNLGINELSEKLKNSQSIFVGQSGVGKSSLINSLFPQQESLVNKVSENSRLGQHTTTASKLFFFEQNDGFIVDSPGVREFGLWHLEPEDIVSGFVEFQPYLSTCKFRDCSHINEPGCSIIQAVKDNKIYQQRWNNYCKILLAKDK
ncbi:small ribosomal subunit biogenesis GTPase RsgA [Aliikangiella sp. G2MR2-5]|uniref:small ribosomal subunit biogenesis GTPase RsgA n=1 Tax=Aliikangiella sp. G2MR2-5 TaxID=2788943 RepID=UPI0018AB873E|nr:small ribosomal subunit biogenesis GTPase RsgA [Aliikangiella sp. G2MR2-5]